MSAPVWDGEEWRAIAGYEGLYEVSNLGRVRTLGGGKARTHGRVLKQSTGTTGYLRVALSRANSSATKKVHRIVAAAFLGPIPVGAYVLHNDGNATNNTASNLRFGNASDNLRDAIAHGSWAAQRGEAAGSAKLTEEDVISIRSSSERITDLANRFSVDRATIRAILTNRSWAHV